MPPVESQLADYVTIQELRHRYCRHVDEQAFERWATLFAEDAVLDINGRDTYTGREEIQSFGTEVLEEQYQYSAHMSMNPLIESTITRQEDRGTFCLRSQ